MSTPVETTVAPTVTSVEEESHKVFVGNLSFTTTDESLSTFFSKSGKVIETIIIKQGSRPKGYGFVGYATAKEAETAAKDLDKKELDGREISVQLAKPREPKPATPPKQDSQPKKSSKKSRKPKAKGEKKEVREKDTNESTKESNETSLISSVETTKAEDSTKESKPKTSVFVANLPLEFEVKDLEELFKGFQVESALVAIKGNGRSKGYGFVELKTVEEMKRVLTEFVDVEVEGRAIHISAATSEKNTERRVKPKTARRPVRRSSKPLFQRPRVTDEESKDDSESQEKKASRPRKSNGKRKPSQKRKPRLSEKENEGIEAAHEAADAVKELKKEDGVEAAKKAQEAVKELKKTDGVEAAKEAKEAVKELKKTDGVEAAKEAKEAVKELKKTDGVEAAKEANKEQSK